MAIGSKGNRGAHWRTNSVKPDSLLVDPRVRLWYNDLVNRSPATAWAYLRGLFQYTYSHHTSPAAFVDAFLAHPRDPEDDVQLWTQELQAAHKAPKSIATKLAGVKSWLAFNRLSFTRKVHLDTQRTPTIEDEPLLSQRQVAALLDLGDLEDKVSVAALAFLGARPTSARLLRLRDFVDLALEDGTAKFRQRPARVNFRRETTKRHRRYFTFLIGQACDYFEAYFQKRLSAGSVWGRTAPCSRRPTVNRCNARASICGCNASSSEP